jgi:glutamine synthetase
VPGADVNPYLAFAATLACGLRGIAEDLDCGEPFRGDAYLGDELPGVPETLSEALSLLEGSSMAREAFGSEMVEFYLHTGRIEAQAFRSAVTDWERLRYFEQL